MCLFKKSPRHVAFRSLPAPKHDVFRPHLQRAAALPGTCYSPSSSSHQPPTEPRTPHEPRLPAAEMLPEQMYRDAHIIHVQTHSTNTHAHAKAHHICPLCEPAAVCRAANSVSSFKSPPKALMCRFFSFSSVGRVPAPTLVNHPDELSAMKARGWGKHQATADDQRADGERDQSSIKVRGMFAVSLKRSRTRINILNVIGKSKNLVNTEGLRSHTQSRRHKQ